MVGLAGSGGTSCASWSRCCIHMRGPGIRLVPELLGRVAFEPSEWKNCSGRLCKPFAYCVNDWERGIVSSPFGGISSSSSSFRSCSAESVAPSTFIEPLASFRTVLVSIIIILSDWTCPTWPLYIMMHSRRCRSQSRIEKSSEAEKRNIPGKVLAFDGPDQSWSELIQSRCPYNGKHSPV